MFKLANLVLIFGLLASCAKVPLADPANDSEVKTFLPLPDKAVVYIYRDSSILGSAFTIPVYVDNAPVAEFGMGCFVRVELVPGIHKLGSVGGSDANVLLNSFAGRVYFVREFIGFGGVYLSKLVDESEGRACVSKCKLVRAVTSQ
jgi:hypothetical protein